MHVYTLVWLKSDQIGFLIVELKHPDYSIDSGINPALRSMYTRTIAVVWLSGTVELWL